MRRALVPSVLIICLIGLLFLGPSASYPAAARALPLSPDAARLVVFEEFLRPT